MIIKNNFNSRSTKPLTDYSKIGKGSHSLEHDLEMEKKGFIRENINNKVLQDLRYENKLMDDNQNEDKLKFFR